MCRSYKQHYKLTSQIEKVKSVDWISPPKWILTPAVRIVSEEPSKRLASLPLWSRFENAWKKTHECWRDYCEMFELESKKMKSFMCRWHRSCCRRGGLEGGWGLLPGMFNWPLHPRLVVVIKLYSEVVGLTCASQRGCKISRLRPGETLDWITKRRRRDAERHVHPIFSISTLNGKKLGLFNTCQYFSTGLLRSKHCLSDRKWNQEINPTAFEGVSVVVSGKHRRISQDSANFELVPLQAEFKTFDLFL